MAFEFLTKGKPAPRNGAEYPGVDHSQWLTIEQAAEFLNVSPRYVRKLVYEYKVIGRMIKRWRYGCWVRRAAFVSKEECLRYVMKRDLHDAKKIVQAVVYIPPINNPFSDGMVFDKPRLVKLNPLRKWRKDNNLSAREVADQLDCREGTILGYEVGRTLPPNPVFETLSNLMGVEFLDLVGRWRGWLATLKKNDIKVGRKTYEPSFKKIAQVEEIAAILQRGNIGPGASQDSANEDRGLADNRDARGPCGDAERAVAGNVRGNDRVHVSDWVSRVGEFDAPESDQALETWEGEGGSACEWDADG